MKNNQRHNMVDLLTQREEFIAIGLTGRIGSGCSTVAKILSSDTKTLQMPSMYPGENGFRDDDERDMRTIVRYYHAHWLAFDVIKSRTIITTFLLEHFKESNTFTKLLQPHSPKVVDDNYIFTELHKFLQDNAENAYTKIQNSPISSDTQTNVNTADNSTTNTNEAETSKVTDSKTDTGIINTSIITNPKLTVLNEIYPQLQKLLPNQGTNDATKKECINDAIAAEYQKLKSAFENDKSVESQIETLTTFFRPLYKEALNQIEYCNYRQYLETVNSLLYKLSAISAAEMINDYISDPQSFWNTLSNINSQLNTKKDSIGSGNNDANAPNNFKNFIFVHDIIPALSSVIHDILITINQDNFTALFQKFGNCIRRFGEIILDDYKTMERLEENQDCDIFAVPRKINQFIKVLRHPFADNFARPVRIVIDSIKNIFEADYLRERYSAFYLFGISTDEATRISRLTYSGGKKLNIKQIHHIDWNEYPSVAEKIYEKYHTAANKDTSGSKDTNNDPLYSAKADTSEEKSFFDNIVGDSLMADHVRKDAYDKKLHQFVLQDVEHSIENADVYISNYGTSNASYRALKWSLIRNVCLILYPGLVQPTPIERCMQIAFSAKVNSGCLSRQVGAVVTDPQYNIVSIGWNDVPCGDISCSRKNLIDLYRLDDPAAYTAYEKGNPDFRSKIKALKMNTTEIGKCLNGLPIRYCFKDFHKAPKDPMRSRAMHGEEKALAHCGKECEGGYLFTTSSTCEMCTKNAKNHKIKKIYYIQPYPGISQDQYSNSGDTENIAEHVLFTGAIGRAYTQMYSPIMPHKDILELLGINDALGITKTDSASSPST